MDDQFLIKRTDSFLGIGNLGWSGAADGLAVLLTPASRLSIWRARHLKRLYLPPPGMPSAI